MNLELPDEHAVMGKQAARRLFHAGISDADIGDPLTHAFARAAITELARLQREEAPGSYREALEGAEASAEQFNVDPLQGVSEVVQNADDLSATTVRVALSGPAGARDELLIVHDGTPVRLVDALSMVLPYLSTKRSSARAKGRFGIGLKTLVKLGARVSVHSAPYDFEIEANLISPGQERDRIAGFYSGVGGETLFAIPLNAGFDEEAFRQWFEDWDSPSLLFLDSVRRVTLFDILSSSSTFDHRLEETATRHVVLAVGDRRLDAQQVVLSDPADGRDWSRYSVELPVPGDTNRIHKATGPTTPVAAAFVARRADQRLFAGLPLRVPSDLPYDLHAQFDIDPSRGHVIQSPWNEWLLANLTDFLTATALERFREDPQLGWFSVAVEPEVAGGDDEWLTTKVGALVELTASEVCEHLRIPIGAHASALSDLVYEEGPLDGLLSPADLERLVPGAVAVLPEIRDRDGRWRQVLDALGVSHAISVMDSLELFDDAAEAGKTDDWCVRLMSLALAAGLGPSLLGKPCLRFADGTTASPHSARRNLLVTEEDTQREPFGAAVGITKTLTLAYRGEDADEIRAWLRSEKVLKDAATPDRVLNALAARARTDPIDIEDDVLLLLRDCLASIDSERRREIGQRVGSAIRVRAYSWTRDGGQRKSWERPTDCYLPSAIDRDPDSWARAAAHAPGPWWIDRTYAELLRTGGDRDRLAAQALFRILGAEIAPRLRVVRSDDSRYNDPATMIRLSSIPPAQLEALRSVAPRATHLQHDWESPDLDAVIADLASDKDKSARKARSATLITVLSRAWPRLYSSHERAKAVHSDYSWYNDGLVPATWVARAASESWLADQNGVLRPPRRLVLRTGANRRIYGDDRSAYVYGLGEEAARAPAILWLGIKSNPRASVLLDELEEMRDCGDTDHPDRVFSLYELLADHIPSGEVSQRALVDDVDVPTMRNRFGSVSRAGGLILAGRRWISPLDVLQGTPIFGNRRAFVPETPRLLPLWRTLAIPAPTTRDALKVLREVASSPDEADSAVLIDTYRFLAAQTKDLSRAQRRTFRVLPLWTDTQWTRSRPLYACEDSALSDALSAVAPVWHPPCSIRTLGNVPARLNVTVLDAAALPVGGVSAVDSVSSAPVRERARAALELLRDHLAEQDPTLYQACSVPWNQLVAADIVLAPSLAVEVRLPGYVPLLIPRSAHLTSQPLTIFAANEQTLGAWDGAGTVIAALFSKGDIDKVALAWEAMWRRASDGQQARGLSLAEAEPLRNSSLDALEQQAKTARRSRGQRQQSSASPAPRADAPTPTPPPPPRRLKSIAQLQVASIDRTGDDTSAGRLSQPKRRGLTREIVPPRQQPDIQRRGLITYTPEDREALALDILRLVLGAEDQEIIDYRHARGIGADAIDIHKRYFELKTATGPASDETTLTANEAERAYRESERFFLAVVSGLEEGEQTEVRLIERPLETLDWKPQTSVTLSGVLRKPALRIVLTGESASKAV